jgi:hypothetical protein
MLYIQNAQIFAGTGKMIEGATFVKRWKVSEVGEIFKDGVYQK